jgi:malate/lactate dehydrogenase
MGVNKIAIVGAGSVGAACAFALVVKDICAEVLIVDVTIPFSNVDSSG